MIKEGMDNMIVNGYQTQTTFWQDFSIAEVFGEDAIKDTFNRAFNEWKSNYIYLTELVMVLNLKLAVHYENGNYKIAKIYDELWGKADLYACENLEGKELRYFLDTTD